MLNKKMFSYALNKYRNSENKLNRIHLLITKVFVKLLQFTFQLLVTSLVALSHTSPSMNPIRRPERRVFGRDITNINIVTDKNDKPQDKHHSLNLKFIPNVKPIEPIKKPQIKFSDPINQYKKDIIEHMLSLQKKHNCPINQNVTQNMREILIDWIIDVHTSFQLKQQTLHLALNYLKDFESKSSSFSKEDYQLVGITCLWIASKYEEIYPPKMSNYTEVTANTYTLGQMRRMEQKILQKLEFNLNHITMLCLLEASIDNHQELSELQKKCLAYAKYILELIMIDENFGKKYNPSKIVATILMVCNQVFKTKLDYKKLQDMKKYSKDEILDCYKEVVELLRAGKSYGGSIKRKYQSDKYFKVGKLKIQLKSDEKPVQLKPQPV